MKRLIKTAFIKTLPVMAGYLVLGFGFGIILENNGYGILLALAMSVFIYAGSMQYVAVGLLSTGASLITVALTTLMVNARHLFYGISMVEPYKKAGKTKPYLIFALTDETYSLVCQKNEQEKKDFYLTSFIISLFNHIYWITGSVLGGIFGTLITFDTAGVDFAMTALFITVFVEQWKSTKNHIPAIAGVAFSVACLLIFGKDTFLVPSMICIALFFILGHKVVEKEEKK